MINKEKLKQKIRFWKDRSYREVYTEDISSALSDILDCIDEPEEQGNIELSTPFTSDGNTQPAKQEDGVEKVNKAYRLIVSYTNQVDDPDERVVMARGWLRAALTEEGE